MKYLGHKATAVVFLPLILFPINNYEGSFQIESLNSLFHYIKFIISNFFNLPPLIIISSLVFYWIGSTFIDFIDFKIIKKLMPKQKQKSQFFYHRQWTHGFIDNLIFLSLSFYLIQFSSYFYLLLFYFFGVWTHLFVDMFSGSIPIFFYGHYGKPISRIGINRILPKSFHDFFSKRIPILYDKFSIILFIVGGILFGQYNGFNILYQSILK